MFPRCFIFLLASALAVFCASWVGAASPTLVAITPRGAQRGTEIDLVLGGDRLQDAQEVVVYEPGLTFTKPEVVSPQQLKVKLKVAAGAALGQHSIRVRTASGLSEIRTVEVGAFPVVDEKEPNSDFASPQKLAIDGKAVTVAGVVENEDVDYFAVEAKKGQRITAEVEGMRMGITFFDPYLAILDANRFELATSDDTALLAQDPIASIVAPNDGTYVIQLRESAYGGDANCQYRLHVGTFPRPRAIYPPGGQAGTDVRVQFVGDVAGPIAQSLKLPAAPTDDLPVFADQNRLTSPSPNHLRVSPFPNVLEAEPNNDAKTATPAPGDLPLGFNGVIGVDGDTDFFKFKAKKDQVFDVNVFARRVRSPLDPVLTIGNADGAAIAANDDAGGPDSYLRFTVPSDGEYTINVHDMLMLGGPDYVYRVELTAVKPSVALTIPPVAPNSQERQAVVVPKGNRFATLIRATRADFAGDLALNFAGLPDGVTTQCENVAANVDVVPVVFEAAPGAAVTGKLCDVTAKPVDPKAPPGLQSVFAQLADLVVGQNQVPYQQARVGKLAVAVAEEVPFKINVVQPKVPIVQNGSMQLKVVAERKPGFAGAIALQVPFLPPGITAGQVQIPGDKNEALVPLNASADAQVRKWKFCVLGSSEVPAVTPPAPAAGKPATPPTPASGPIWVSSQLADLDVAAPFFGMKIAMSAAEQGKPAQVLCTLEQKTKFDGKAKVQLTGLPGTVTAPEAEITAADPKVVFNVTTTDKSPVGQHNTLFCVVTVMKDGEPIVHNVGQGGVLRIDPPSASAPAASATPAPAPAPAAAAGAGAGAAPVSRLEKLRQEQAAKLGK